MINGRKIVVKMEVTVGGTKSESKRNFKEHVKFIGEKASAT